MDAISWQTPLLFLGSVFLLRIISAPYFVWKEENLKNKALEAKHIDLRSPERILYKKTYSVAGKNTLSDLFRELKTLFEGEMRRTEGECQKLVWQIYKTTTYLINLHELAREVINKLNLANANLDRIKANYPSEKEAFEGIVGTEIPNPLTKVKHAIEERIESIHAAQRIQNAGAKDDDLRWLLTIVSVGVREETAKFNGWIAETINKIASVEAELEKK